MAPSWVGDVLSVSDPASVSLEAVVTARLARPLRVATAALEKSSVRDGMIQRAPAGNSVRDGMIQTSPLWSFVRDRMVQRSSAWASVRDGMFQFFVGSAVGQMVMGDKLNLFSYHLAGLLL